MALKSHSELGPHCYVCYSNMHTILDRGGRKLGSPKGQQRHGSLRIQPPSASQATQNGNRTAYVYTLDFNSSITRRCPYTSAWPIFENGANGTFNVVAKTYYPDPSQLGGAVSNILECLALGEDCEVRGLLSLNKDRRNGNFTMTRNAVLITSYWPKGVQGLLLGTRSSLTFCRAQRVRLRSRLLMRRSQRPISYNGASRMTLR